MDDFERRCLRKKRQVFVEHVEITAGLLEDMKAKGLISREHVEHILVSIMGPLVPGNTPFI